MGLAPVDDVLGFPLLPKTELLLLLEFPLPLQVWIWLCTVLEEPCDEMP